MRELYDLAAKYPAKVTELGAKIEGYLQGVETATPQPNPALNPVQYHPEKTGVQTGGVRTFRKLELIKTR
jgi:hypothetical protein